MNFDQPSDYNRICAFCPEVGGGLARQIYQLLGEDADVRPLEGLGFAYALVVVRMTSDEPIAHREGNMYMEAALLGEMRVNDTKAGMVTASFQNFKTQVGC